jgi:hypothetical protein
VLLRLLYSLHCINTSKNSGLDKVGVANALGPYRDRKVEIRRNKQMSVSARHFLRSKYVTELLEGKVARVTGLEPATSGVTGRHSNQLSYARAKGRFRSSVGGGVRAPPYPVKRLSRPIFGTRHGLASGGR